MVGTAAGRIAFPESESSKIPKKEATNMNRIFKVIYSKTKHIYVVASELAKNHSRSKNGGG